MLRLLRLDVKEEVTRRTFMGATTRHCLAEQQRITAGGGKAVLKSRTLTGLARSRR
jgi:hypothetical protein